MTDKRVSLHRRRWNPPTSTHSQGSHGKKVVDRELGYLDADPYPRCWRQAFRGSFSPYEFLWGVGCRVDDASARHSPLWRGSFLLDKARANGVTRSPRWRARRHRRVPNTGLLFRVPGPPSQSKGYARTTVYIWRSANRCIPVIPLFRRRGSNVRL